MSNERTQFPHVESTAKFRFAPEVPIKVDAKFAGCTHVLRRSAGGSVDAVRHHRDGLARSSLLLEKTHDRE